MSRRTRVIIELFGPPLVAAIVYSTTMVALSRDMVFAKAFILILLFAYIFAVIPSVAFTVVMEISFARGLKVSSWHTPLFAALLGALSGVIIALAWARGFDNSHDAFSLFPALGLVTGAIVGAVVRSLSKKEPNQPLEPTPPGGVAHL